MIDQDHSDIAARLDWHQALFSYIGADFGQLRSCDFLTRQITSSAIEESSRFPSMLPRTEATVLRLKSQSIHHAITLTRQECATTAQTDSYVNVRLMYHQGYYQTLRKPSQGMQR